MPTATIITYKGLKVVSPEPTTDGGLGLNFNFRSIADSLEQKASTSALAHYLPLSGGVLTGLLTASSIEANEVAAASVSSDNLLASTSLTVGQDPSSVIIADGNIVASSGHLLLGTSTHNGTDRLQVDGSISAGAAGFSGDVYVRSLAIGEFDAGTAFFNSDGSISAGAATFSGDVNVEASIYAGGMAANAIEAVESITLAGVPLGTAATKNTGTASGQIPVLGAGGGLTLAAAATNGLTLTSPSGQTTQVRAWSNNRGVEIIGGSHNEVAITGQVRSDGGFNTSTSANAMVLSGFALVRTGSGRIQFETGIASLPLMTINSASAALANYATLKVDAFKLDAVALVVNGASGQTANLQEWGRSSTTGLSLASVSAAGKITGDTISTAIGGSESVPAITIGDNDTGFYRGTTNRVSVATGGSTAAFFDAAGVNIPASRDLLMTGTSNIRATSGTGPAGNYLNNFNNNNGLVLQKTSTGTGNYLEALTSAGVSLLKLDTAGLLTAVAATFSSNSGVSGSSTSALRVTAVNTNGGTNADAGFRATAGTTIASFGAKSPLAGEGFANSALFDSSGDMIVVAGNQVISGGSGTFQVRTGGYGTSQERMRVTAAGRMLLGTTIDNGTDKLQVNGSVLATGYSVGESQGVTITINTDTHQLVFQGGILIAAEEV